jgi:hypothetical protein
MLPVIQASQFVAANLAWANLYAACDERGTVEFNCGTFYRKSRRAAAQISTPDGSRFIGSRWKDSRAADRQEISKCN